MLLLATWQLAQSHEERFSLQKALERAWIQFHGPPKSMKELDGLQIPQVHGVNSTTLSFAHHLVKIKLAPASLSADINWFRRTLHLHAGARTHRPYRSPTGFIIGCCSFGQLQGLCHLEEALVGVEIVQEVIQLEAIVVVIFTSKASEKKSPKKQPADDDSMVNMVLKIDEFYDVEEG